MSNPPTTLEYRTQTKHDPIWPITIGGFAIMLLVGAMMAAALLGVGKATSQPSDVPLPQTILIGYGTSLVTTAALVIGDLVYRPGALQKLGLTRRRIGKGIWWGVRAAVIIVPIVFTFNYLTELFWQAVHYSHESAHPLLRLYGESTRFEQAAIIVLAAIVAPIGEELLFRGHLQVAMTRSFSKLPAGAAATLGIIGASLVFTLFHGELWMMPPLMVLSLLMGAVFHWTQNVVASIAIHVCFNCASLTYFWLVTR